MSTRSATLREVAEVITQQIQFVGGEDTEAGHALVYLADRFRRMATTTPAADASVPRQIEPDHPLPCEYPDVLPCLCPVRPHALSEEAYERARRRSCVGAYFNAQRRYATSAGAL